MAWWMLHQTHPFLPVVPHLWMFMYKENRVQSNAYDATNFPEGKSRALQVGNRKLDSTMLAFFSISLCIRENQGKSSSMTSPCQTLCQVSAGSGQCREMRKKAHAVSGRAHVAHRDSWLYIWMKRSEEILQMWPAWMQVVHWIWHLWCISVSKTSIICIYIFCFVDKITRGSFSSPKKFPLN